MKDIAPGDYVKCIDARSRYYSTAELTAGAIYTIKELLDTEQGPACNLNELPYVEYHDGDNWVWGYHLDRFIPIYRPKANLIPSLLEPIKVDA